MPRSKPAPGKKRPRAKMTPKVLLEEISRRAFDLETPLTDTRHLVLALRMIGDGMVADNNDEGLPIGAVARAVIGRLDDLERGWLRILKTARKRKR
jgi:hypothetical protein